MNPLLLIGFDLKPPHRATVAETLGEAGRIAYLPELDGAPRAEALRSAAVLLAVNTDKELRPGEAALLAGVRLVQFVTAGVDFIRLSELPSGVPVASNGGAYAAPMAEHALAMALAAAKRLPTEHAKLARGEFDQFARNRMLAGGVCGIFGFGGVGRATARLARGIGMRVHAINRHGRSEEPTDWIGTPDRLDDMLAVSDLLVVAAPLTRATLNRIGAAQLARMKEDAILVNLARGEIIEEAALYAHLRANPRFTACIDAWWIEPVRHGRFGMDHPFLDLPNVIGSPHNSGQAGATDAGLLAALENCRRALVGQAPLRLIGDQDRMR